MTLSREIFFERFSDDGWNCHTPNGSERSTLDTPFYERKARLSNLGRP